MLIPQSALALVDYHHHAADCCLILIHAEFFQQLFLFVVLIIMCMLFFFFVAFSNVYNIYVSLTFDSRDCQFLLFNILFHLSTVDFRLFVPSQWYRQPN